MNDQLLGKLEGRVESLHENFKAMQEKLDLIPSLCVKMDTLAKELEENNLRHETSEARLKSIEESNAAMYNKIYGARWMLFAIASGLVTAAIYLNDFIDWLRKVL